jgi:hypothetical protein
VSEERIAELRAKLAKSAGKPGYVERAKTIEEEIARLTEENAKSEFSLKGAK